MRLLNNSKLDRALRWTLLAVATLSTAACEPVSIHAPNLAGWSPDGTRVVLVPFPYEALDGKQSVDSGIWVTDFVLGKTTRILALHNSRIAFSPRWSPYDDMLLFATGDLEGSDFKKQDGLLPLTIWTMPADGGPVYRVAEALVPDEDTVVANLVKWGPSQGTIIYTSLQNDEMMAVTLNLVTGDSANILPFTADSYSLEFSPSRSTAVLVLHDKAQDRRSLYVAPSSNLASWRLIDSLAADRDGHDSTDSQEVFWSPNSSRFVVLEKAAPADSAEAKCCFARIYDPLSRRNTAIWIEEPNTGVIWSGDGESLFYSNKNGIFQADIENRTNVCLVQSLGLRLLSINREDGQLNFFRTLKEDEPYTSPDGVTHYYYHRIYSSSSDGLNVREIASKIPTDDWFWDRSPDGKHVLFSTVIWPTVLLSFGSFRQK